MVIFIKDFIIKTIFLFNILFIFNIDSIDSNNSLSLSYNRYLNESSYYVIYFKNMNSNDINIINDLNIHILSYIIDNKKYYAKNTKELVNKYNDNLSKEEKIYNELKGIKIDGITILCETNELLKLEKLVKIY